MKTSIAALSAALVIAAPITTFASSAAPVASPASPVYSVFVDQPTGFTFVKMPSGWKFVGAVSKDDAQHLPDNVLRSSSLPEDYAQSTAAASLK